MTVNGRESDDYQSDIRFGEWLRLQRGHSRLTLEAAAEKAELSVERLKGLEMGFSDRGITQQESAKLSSVYGVRLSVFLHEATRG